MTISQERNLEPDVVEETLSPYPQNNMTSAKPQHEVEDKSQHVGAEEVIWLRKLLNLVLTRQKP